jgi:hypothetical protein
MRYLYFVLGLMAFWSVFLTIIFRVEKRMVWLYGDLEPQCAFQDPSGYGVRWVNDAVASGFTMLGWARDVRGGIYRLNYAVLVSAQRDVLAVIGVGALGRLPFAATWLHTPTSNGRSFYSTDKQSGVQIDLSGDWTNQLAFAGSFRELLQQHRDWLRMNGVTPRPFTQGQEVAEFRRLREGHYRTMERAGLIGFTDGTESHFYFTLPGAAKTAVWSYFLGMARQLTLGKFPRNA